MSTIYVADRYIKSESDIDMIDSATQSVVPSIETDEVGNGVMDGSPVHSEGDSSFASTQGSASGPRSADGGQELDFWACAQRSMRYTLGVQTDAAITAAKNEADMLQEAHLRKLKVTGNRLSAVRWIRQVRAHLEVLVQKFDDNVPAALEREMVGMQGLRLLAKRSYVNGDGKLVFRNITIVSRQSRMRAAERSLQNKPSLQRSEISCALTLPTRPAFQAFNKNLAV